MMNFHRHILNINCKKEEERICSFLQQQTISMKRNGIVIGISGGIDSALCLELCVKSLEKDKVLGLLLPERESNPISVQYARKEAEKLDIKTELIDITSTLEAFGTYKRRDQIIQEIFPEYDSGYQSKITLPSDLLSKEALNFFTLTIRDRDGNEKSIRLNSEALKGIVAATNIKQRTRMMYLYYYAEKNNFLVCGTTNKSETVQGFFVKYGDGGVDIEPIAHLYKTQVYQLSKHFGVIQEIMNRIPSPDTYSYDISDEEFYFRIPYDKLDLLLYAWENNIEIKEISAKMDLTEEQIKRVFRDFNSKYFSTEHLRCLPPTLKEELPKEIRK